MTRFLIALIAFGFCLLAAPAHAQLAGKGQSAKAGPSRQITVPEPDLSASGRSQASPWLSRLDGSPGSSDTSVTGRLVQMTAVLTLLSVAPALLIMLTSFTRFIIVFSLLRGGLGLQGAPANIVLISLACFMTLYVMAPTFDQSWEKGVKPWTESRIGDQEAFKLALEPFQKFMKSNVREKDLEMFEQLAAKRGITASGGGADDLRILVPAFMISELRRAFEIGFLILLPFLVIDLVMATLVMSMGMMMLSPTVFSLPCKILFFVLIDGWNLLVNGLVRSFA